jgi:hypothetical protein
MILEYRRRQLALRHQPTEAIIDISSPLEYIHIISPEPEALPTPPWFFDDVSQDSPYLPYPKIRNLFLYRMFRPLT